MSGPRRGPEAYLAGFPPGAPPYPGSDEPLAWKHDYYELFRMLYERLNRLLEETAVRHQDLVAASNPLTHVWEPAVDVYEHDTYYLIEVEIAGADPDLLEIHMENKNLWIRGSRPPTQECPEEEYYRIEIPEGDFERTVHLPEDASPRRIQSSYTGGILRIRVPRRKRRKKGSPHRPSRKQA